MYLETKKHPDTSKEIRVAIYDDLGDMARGMEEIPNSYQECMNDAGWNECGVRKDCLNLMWKGDDKLLQKTKNNLSSVENLLAPLTKKRKRRASPFGVLQVPAYLAGHPTPCARRTKALSDQGPVRIFMDMSTSCAISGKDLMQYRMMITSFAAALSKLRQVDLTAFVITDTWGLYATGISVPVPLRPLDAVSVTTIAHVAMFRGLMLDKLRELGEAPHDSLPLLGSSKNHALYLGAKRGDIITPQITPGILREIIGDMTEAEAVQKLMRDFLSGKGFVFQTIEERKNEADF